MPPLISVVVPSYNRRELLQRCLESLAVQDLAPDCFEVIVVLDGSNDGSAEMARQFSVPFALTVIEQANAGVGAARNAGAAAAAGEYLVFLDDDMQLDPGFVRAHLEAQQGSGGVVAIGRISTSATHRGFPSYSIEYWTRLEGNLGRRPLRFTDMFGGNQSMPAAAWRQTGGFDTSLQSAEDIEFASRLAKAGYAFAFVPGARSHQTFVKATRECLRDQLAAGRSDAELVARHPEMLPHLRLGWLGVMTPLRRRLLRTALALPLPVAPFAWFGSLPNTGPVRRAYSSIANYWYMRGARETALRTGTWHDLSRNRRRPPAVRR